MGPATLYGTLKKLVDQGLAEELAHRPDGRRRQASPVLPAHRLGPAGLRRGSRPPRRTGADRPEQPRARTRLTMTAPPAVPVPGPPLPERLPARVRRGPRRALRRPRCRPRHPGGPNQDRPRPGRHHPPLPPGARHDRTAQRHDPRHRHRPPRRCRRRQRDDRARPRHRSSSASPSCSPSPSAARSPAPYRVPDSNLRRRRLRKAAALGATFVASFAIYITLIGDTWTSRETVLAIVGNLAMFGAVGYLIAGLLTPRTPDQIESARPAA